MPVLKNQDTKSSRNLLLAGLRPMLPLRRWGIKAPKTRLG